MQALGGESMNIRDLINEANFERDGFQTCRGCRHLRLDDPCDTSGRAEWRYVCKVGHRAYAEDGTHIPRPASECVQRDPRAAGDPNLQDKLWYVERVGAICRLRPEHLHRALIKTVRGHAEHDDDATIDPVAEARDELADVVGYAAIARWRGLWSWRWRVVVWLAGVQWRILGLGRRGSE